MIPPGMTHIRQRLGLLCMLGMASCSTLTNPVVTPPSGPPALSGAVLGRDLLKVGAAIQIGVLVLPLVPDAATVPPNVLTDLTNAAQGINAAGASLVQGNPAGAAPAVTGSLAADINAADQAYQVVIAAIGIPNPDLAAKLLLGRRAFLDAIALYNLDAKSYGLPPLAMPAGA